MGAMQQVMGANVPKGGRKASGKGLSIGRVKFRCQVPITQGTRANFLSFRISSPLQSS